MFPLVVYVYVLTLMKFMTLNCHIHSCNDGHDDDDIFFLLWGRGRRLGVSVGRSRYQKGTQPPVHESRRFTKLVGGLK